MTTSTAWANLDKSLQLLADVASGVTTADFARATPCSDWNVLQVLQHAAGDQIGYASSLTGVPGPTFNPFDPSGDPTTDIQGLVAETIATSSDAWATVPADSGAVEIPIPIGPVDAKVAAAACALDAAVHAWDVAVALGRPSPLDDELSAALLEDAATFVEPVRAFAYAPVVPSAEGESATHSLLRFLGRDPHWTA